MVDLSLTLMIRADAGGDFGAGHVMRMIALAQSWQQLGAKVLLLAASCPQKICDRLKSENIQFESISSKPGSPQDLKQTLSIAAQHDVCWIVLDGYHFDEVFQKGIKSMGYCLLCVDDFGHCARWDCDIILNQNFHGLEEQQKYLVTAPDSRYLLGPDFALLRKEFLQKSGSVNRRFNKQPVVMITFGGVDPDNFTEKVLSFLAKTRLTVGLRVIVGAGNQNLHNLNKRLANIQGDVSIVVDVQNMANEYAKADAVISACGSSAFEWLSYQIPAIAVVIAQNQEPMAAHLRKVTGVEVLDFRDMIEIELNAGFFSAFDALLGRIGNRTKVPKLIDGEGAKRVRDSMLALNNGE